MQQTNFDRAHRASIESRNTAQRKGGASAHFVATVLPHRELQNKPFSIATMIAKIAEAAQREATGSRSVECTRGFHASSIHT